MTSMNQVQIIGKITLEPKFKTFKSGAKLAELGIGIPESKKKENGEWESAMHFVDVVLWSEQAEYAEAHLKRGDGVMVLGSLQYESWEKDGKKQSKVRVKGKKVQYLEWPTYEAGAQKGRGGAPVRGAAA